MRSTSVRGPDPCRLQSSAAPLGIRSLPPLSIKAHRCLVLVLTFFCYATYHASRKAPSIVKSVLSGSTINGPGEQSQQLTGLGPFHWPIWPNDKGRAADDSEGWAPFNGPNGRALLGDLDLAFLGAYALGMFFAGHLGDRLNLRHFLTLGMLASAVLTAAFGLGQAYQVHSIWYYVVVQVMAGVVQASGWPSVVAIMGNWYGKGKRGLIMGLWNAHTSLGNMLGSVVASAVLPYGWGYAFLLPAGIMGAMALIIALYLVVEPEDIGYGSPYEDSTSSDATPRSSISSLSANALRYLERHPQVRGRHPYAQLHAHSQLKRWGSSSSLSELSRASSGHPLNILEAPRSPFQSQGHFAHPIPSSSRSALSHPAGLDSAGDGSTPMFSLPPSFRQISSAPQHATLSSEPSSNIPGQGSPLQHAALPFPGQNHGTSDIGSHSWVQLPPNAGNTTLGDPKQSLPTPEGASQGLADITSQAARSQHAAKPGSQITVAGPLSASQVSAVNRSHTPQPIPQQHLQANSTGNSRSTPLAPAHSPKPASLTSRLSHTRDPVRQAGALHIHARDSFRQGRWGVGALPVPARDPSRQSGALFMAARGLVMQADRAAGCAASTVQASSLNQDHAEAQRRLLSQDHVQPHQPVLSHDLIEAQQQHMCTSSPNLPRLVGLSSTLCLLDLPDLKGFQGKDGKLTLAADRAGVRHVSFWAACCIPGVAAYALTLFFCKLVAYTFLYWLPYYINSVTIASTKLSPQAAGNLSVLFDLGGVLGGSIAGFISDQTSASACTSCAFVLAAIPALFLYQSFGTVSLPMNIGLMMLAGLLVNGPYALITTAVSADLGTHHSLQGGGKALATVTAIIDGMGSCGAALGPVLTGHLVTLRGGFDNVFLMLYIAAAAAGLLLSKLAYKEVADRQGNAQSGHYPAADSDILQRLLDDDQQLLGAMQ